MMLFAILVKQHLSDGKMTRTKQRCMVVYSKKPYTRRVRKQLQMVTLQP